MQNNISGSFCLDCVVKFDLGMFSRDSPQKLFSRLLFEMYISVDDFRLFVTHVTWPKVILRKSKPSFESCSAGGKVHC